MARLARRLRLRPPLLAGLLVGLLALASAAVTSAKPPARAWPHPIRVYNPTGWQSSVRVAMRAWNRSGAGVRFTLVRERADADVIIVASDAALLRACRPVRDCIGYSSQVGYRGGAGRPLHLYLPEAPAHEPPDDAPIAATAAHELGHVLGLHHRGGCSLMNGEALTRTCPEKDLYPTFQTYLCGPLAIDVDAAAGLYGGRRAAGYEPVCRLAGTSA